MPRIDVDDLDVARAYKYFPHTLAQVMSQGEWSPFPHLAYISRRIARGVIRGGYNAIVNMPPGHGKSQLINDRTSTWFLNMRPDKRVLLASYEADFAAEWGRKVRDRFMLSRKGIRKDVAAAKRWNTEQGGGMVTGGVGGPFTGRHGDLLILDDPHKNLDEALSAAKLHQLKSWWDSTFMMRKKQGASTIVLHTRWHEEDMTGWLLSKDDADIWDHIIIKAIAEDDDPLGRQPGEPLCPTLKTLDELLAAKKRNNNLFEAMYQQNPVPITSSGWSREWWQYWETLPDGVQWLQSWDLAFKDKKTSDYVVGQVWAYRGSNAWLVHQVRGKFDIVRTIQQIRAVSKRFPQAATKLIEDKANGPAVMSLLKGEIGGMVPVEPYGSKVARAISVQPYIEGGDVYLPKPGAQVPWLSEFITECHRFPTVKHDDQVDAASQALRRIFRESPGILIGSLL